MAHKLLDEWRDPIPATAPTVGSGAASILTWVASQPAPHSFRRMYDEFDASILAG